MNKTQNKFANCLRAFAECPNASQLDLKLKSGHIYRDIFIDKIENDLVFVEWEKVNPYNTNISMTSIIDIESIEAINSTTSNIKELLCE